MVLGVLRRLPLALGGDLRERRGGGELRCVDRREDTGDPDDRRCRDAPCDGPVRQSPRK
jgi:hypothetical protein